MVVLQKIMSIPRKYITFASITGYRTKQTHMASAHRSHWIIESPTIIHLYKRMFEIYLSVLFLNIFTLLALNTTNR